MADDRQLDPKWSMQAKFLVLIDPTNECIRVQFPHSHHLRSPCIEECEAIMLGVSHHHQHSYPGWRLRGKGYSRDYIGLKFASDQSLGQELPWSCHPRSPWIEASGVTLLTVHRDSNFSASPYLLKEVNMLS